MQLTLVTGLLFALCTLGTGQQGRFNYPTGNRDSSSGFCTGKPYGLYGNPANPTTFYNCGASGLTYLQKCPAGLVFDKSCTCCNYPAGTSTIRNNVCAGLDNGLYVNSANPQTFYNCVNGITYLQNCPAGLVFDQSCTCCNWPAATAIDNSKFCTGKAYGQYVNTADSTTFYNCGQNGLTYIQKCPAGLKFDQSCSCCNWP